MAQADLAAMARGLTALDTEAAAEAVWLHVADALACRAAGARAGIGAAAGLGEVAEGVAAIRASGAEAVHLPTGLRPASVAVPAALAEAETAEALLRGVAGGYAAGLALVEALGGSEAAGRGLWPTRLVAPAVAAASAGLARGIGSAVLETALASALADLPRQAEARAANAEPGPTLAAAALTGLDALAAAEAGSVGDAAGSDLLVRAEALAEVAGDAVARTGLRPFAVPRKACAAISAVAQVRAAGIDPDDVLECELYLPPEAVAEAEPGEDEALGPLLGLAFVAPGALMEPVRGAPPEAAAEFAAKVSVTASPELSEPGRWPARLRLKTLDGVFERRVDAIAGDPDDPDREGLVRRKAEAFGVGQGTALLDALAAGEDGPALLARARAATG